MARTGSQRKTPSTVESNASIATLEQQNISRKSKFRYLTARSETFEKQLAELFTSLSGYARRVAKLRDSGDMVAEALNAMSMAEVLNPSLKMSTSEMAKSIRAIQDHRDSEVLYFEDKLLPVLSQFGVSLQKQREEVRSTTNKVFEGKERSKWSSASRSSSRRSQSAERAEKPTKEEKALQQSVQRYELRRNLVLRKMLLKIILSELRYTCRAFNSLTETYKNVSRGLNPVDDLKVFNEFFRFRSLNKAALNEVEDDVSDVESNDEEADNSEDEDSDESGLEENNDSDGDTDRGLSPELDSRRSQNDEESESSKSDMVSIQSTLRRFNSTPEMTINLGDKENNRATSSASKSSKGKSNKKSSDHNKNDVEMSLEKAAKAANNKRNNAGARNAVPDEFSDDDDDDEDDEVPSNSNEIRAIGKAKTFAAERTW